MPAAFVIVPPLKAAILGTLNTKGESCLNVLSLADGKIQHAYCSALVIDTLGYDTKSQRVFFDGYDTKKSKNFLYELKYKTNGSMVELVEIPGLVQVRHGGCQRGCHAGRYFRIYSSCCVCMLSRHGRVQR